MARSQLVRRNRAIGIAIPAAVALAAVLAPVAQAGVSAQHNETLVVV